MAATSSTVGVSPMHITSGFNGALLTQGRFKVNKIYWKQPTLESTSHLLITRGGTAGIEYVNMKVEVSGQSQQMDFAEGVWWKDPYIMNMPTGDLYIYYL